MKNTIKHRLSWHLTCAVIFVFLAETLLFIGYHLVEYWGRPDALREDFFEIGIMILFNLLALPVLLYATRYLIKKELAPLESAADTAASIQAGLLTRRIEVQNPPEEIDHLASAFNAAFDRYHFLLEKSQQFNADASHQLRTPLAIMRTTGEVSLSQSRSDSEYREVIGSMLEETEHLQKIVDQLLELARISQESLEIERIPVRPLLQRIMDRFAPVLEDFPNRVTLQCDAEPHIQGNKVLLIEALSNLLDNALTHTPAADRIMLGVSETAETVTLKVCDCGPGIPAEDAERLLDRFYRRSTDGRGSGLGLAIVKAIADLHEAKLLIKPNQPHGTCVTMHFPKPAPV